MTEAYTYDDDIDHRVGNNVLEAQVFTPVEDHVCWYVAAKIWNRNYQYRWSYQIRSVLDGLPTSGIIDQSSFMPDNIAEYGFGKLYRRKLNGYAHLWAGTQYAFVIDGTEVPWGPCIWWRTDKGNGKYPRGYRCFSEDGGHTWQKAPNDDHLFYEFGSPQSPPPPPNAPERLFAITRLVPTMTPIGWNFRITTTIPCHMRMYWTNIYPERHGRNILVRGRYLESHLKHCFVNWKTVHQCEEGDTLLHWFRLNDWPFYERRWFTFRAEIDHDWSSSATPIFSKVLTPTPLQPLGIEPWTCERLDAPDYERILFEEWTT